MRAVAIVLSVHALLALGLAAAAQAGPCAQEIAAVQVEVDAFLEATAAAGPSRPQRSFAGLHRQPTPAALARAEQSARGEQAVAALARARNADQAGNVGLCRAALADARRALER